MLPAIVPDFALFHAPLADRQGNVWVGRQGDLRTLAHAAKASLVTVEDITDDELMEDEKLASGAIPALYISGIAKAPNGSWPLALPGYYGEESDYLAGYCAAAASEDGLAAWLADEGLIPRAAAE